MVRSEQFLGESTTSGLRAARRTGRRRLSGFVILMVLVCVATAVAAGPVAAFADRPVFALAWTGVALSLLALRGAGTARSWRVWTRADRGEPTLRFEATAVATQRTVSGRLMRTVVVRRGGVESYVHLLFAEDREATRLKTGPVTLDLFGGTKVTGPARLTQRGQVLWAFTSKEGRPVAPQAERRGSRGTVSDGGGTQIVGTGATPQHHLVQEPYPQPSGHPTGTYSGDGWSGGSSWGPDPAWSGTSLSGGDGGSDSGGGGGGDSGGGGGGD